jgi:hypothetical protein
MSLACDAIERRRVAAAYAGVRRHARMFDHFTRKLVAMWLQRVIRRRKFDASNCKSRENVVQGSFMMRAPFIARRIAI